LIIVALPAVEVLKKTVPPPCPQVVMAAVLVMTVPLPAVALFEKIIPPPFPASSTAVTKFCATPELLVRPVPLRVNVKVGLAVIANALAPALKTMPSTSVVADRETAVVLDVAKKAMSDGPLGGPPAVQFVAVFQSPVAGLDNHVALPAKLLLAVERRSVRMAAAERRKAHARERWGEGDARRSDGAM